MDYQASIALLTDLSKFGIKQGLSRIEELLSRLGEPQLQGTRYVQVAGTNGKGSTAAMLNSILIAAGRRTGFFSSPHLTCYRDRYRLNGEFLSEEQMAALLSEIAPHLEAMTAAGQECPTEFEVSTALALLWFARERAEWAVMETGMGGAIDSTNVVPGELAVITNVALDHQRYLGDTVAEIARVKAGIIKPGAAVVTAAEGVALSVIEAQAAAQQAELWRLEQEITVSGQDDAFGQRLTVRTPGHCYRDLALPLLGQHQQANAALAVAAAERAGCPEAAIRAGLAAVSWPGRLEVLSRQPLVVMDGAHNEAGMSALAASLRRYWPQRRVVAVLGMLADKARRQALAHLLPLLDQVIVVKPDNQRAGDWQYLVELAQAAGVPAHSAESIEAACREALTLVDELGEQGLLLAAGSLYVMSPARRFLLEELTK